MLHLMTKREVFFYKVCYINKFRYFNYSLKFLYKIAQIPIFLYPFLQTTSNKTRPFEYLRLTSLGVIGALVKVHINFFSLNKL